MNLTLIETSGNQRYIYATNKLRENVGASELTFQVGTKAVLKAIGKETLIENDKDGAKLRDFLLNETGENPPLNADKDSVEVVIATSGKAILLTNTPEKAKEIIRKVTETALREMPGLTVHGVISTNFSDLEGRNAKGKPIIHEKIGEVHRKLEDVRYKMPATEQRFQRLPFFAPCKTSGLPANEIYKNETLSTVSVEKTKFAEQGRDRLEAIIKKAAPEIVSLKDLETLEKRFEDLKWLAVVHADGNGLGGIFLNFDEHSGKSGREYLNEYREFSLALDECTLKATGAAVRELHRRWQERNKSQIQTIEVPFVPLVLGGDDLTVLMDGEYAVNFTRDFLIEFENQTENKPTVKRIAEEAFPAARRLSSCAGIAIVKPKFPFHQAYELSEALLKSAKKVKEKVQIGGEMFPVSALDYHVLYDSSQVSLDAIREKLKKGETRLFAKPYVVTNENKLFVPTDKNELSEQAKNWLNHRKFAELEIRVGAMSEKEDNRRKLPNSQLHDLRESLFLGAKEADARAKLISHRYDGFEPLFVAEDSLFFKERDEKEGDKMVTHFLDAIEIVEFWK